MKNIAYGDEDFYEFLDNLIDSTKSPKEIIKEENIDIEKIKDEIIAFSNDFLTLCKKYNLDITNRADLCKRLEALNFSTENEELTFIFCVLICDKTYLMSWNKKITDSEIINFIKLKNNVNSLITIIENLKLQKEDFDYILSKIKSINIGLVNVNENEKNTVLKIFLDYMSLTDTFNKEDIKENIEYILAILHSNSYLKIIAPLFIFKVLIKHKKRICTKKIEQFKIEKLFDFDKYKIEEDNGKNFNTLFDMCKMFAELLSYYSSFDYVNTDLCKYGFYATSNICSWYYNIDFEDDNCNDYFLMPMDFIVDLFLFSCFENGLDDALLYTEYLKEKGIHIIPNSFKTDKISDSVYESITEADCESFIEIYAENDLQKTKAFIKTIFDKIKLPSIIDIEDISLVYAIINEILLYETDKLSNKRLINIGKKLIGE